MVGGPREWEEPGEQVVGERKRIIGIPVVFRPDAVVDPLTVVVEPGPAGATHVATHALHMCHVGSNINWHSARAWSLLLDAVVACSAML